MVARRRERSGRLGMSLIEVLAVISILGVILGLILPAVQAARAAARRGQCANNLKQIGLAMHLYESVHLAFPEIQGTGFSPRSRGRLPDMSYPYSPLARMLPQLEQAAVFDSINFGFEPTSTQGRSVNDTSMRVEISLFLCPVGERSAEDGYAACDYRFSIGPTPDYTYGATPPAHWGRGAFALGLTLRPADFLDGLSSTIGVSERLQGDWTKEVFSPGDYRLLPIGRTNADADEALALCAAAPEDAESESRSGESWFISSHHTTCFNQCAPPNSRLADCAFDTLKEDFHWRTIHQGVFTARSFHPGGVNVLHMDGSVRFVGDGVSRATWRAVGSRDGGEVVSTVDY